MASWIIVRGGLGLEATTVFYHNHVTDTRYPLGKLSEDVSDESIVEWVFSHGGPAYGDRIRLSDGSLYIYQQSHACS